MNRKHALIPGTFDPVTLGHLAVIRTAADIFEKITVCILVNPDKQCMFDEETRARALKIAVAEFSNVGVAVSHGMTADFAKEIGAGIIVRGVRNTEDMAYELKMADFNHARSGVETCLLTSPQELHHLSSTAARAALSAGEKPSGMLPDGVWELLVTQMKKSFP